MKCIFLAAWSSLDNQANTIGQKRLSIFLIRKFFETSFWFNLNSSIKNRTFRKLMNRLWFIKCFKNVFTIVSIFNGDFFVCFYWTMLSRTVLSEILRNFGLFCLGLFCLDTVCINCSQLFNWRFFEIFGHGYLRYHFLRSIYLFNHWFCLSQEGMLIVTHEKGMLAKWMLTLQDLARLTSEVDWGSDFSEICFKFVLRYVQYLEYLK